MNNVTQCKTARINLPISECILLDLDSLPPDLELATLPELLKGILLNTIKYLDSFNSGDASSWTKLSIYVVRNDASEIILQPTCLIPGAWRDINQALKSLVDNIRSARFDGASTGFGQKPEQSQDSMEAALEKILANCKSLSVRTMSERNYHKIVVITQRISQIKDILNVFVGFPPEMLPVHILLPDRIETRVYEEDLDQRIIKTERFTDCEELGGCLRSQLLGHMLPGGVESSIIVQLTSRGSKERILLRVLRTGIDTDSPVENELFLGGGQETLVLEGVRMIKVSGICLTSIAGEMFIATLPTQRDMEWARWEENRRNLTFLYRELFSYGNCLLLQSDRNLYILQPYTNNKLGLMRVKTSENIVMLPEMKSEVEDSYETGGWNLLSILNDMPKDETFNPLEYKTRVTEQLEAWVNSYNVNHNRAKGGFVSELSPIMPMSSKNIMPLSARAMSLPTGAMAIPGGAMAIPVGPRQPPYRGKGQRRGIGQRKQSSNVTAGEANRSKPASWKDANWSAPLALRAGLLSQNNRGRGIARGQPRF